jgi:hypothetical protein
VSTLGVRRNVVITAQKMSMPSLTYLSSIIHAPIALARVSGKAPKVVKMRAANVIMLALSNASAVLSWIAPR